MVTRSIDNFKQHKEVILKLISQRYDNKKAEKFIQYYSKSYDLFNRSFIDYRLAFWLMDDIAYVKRVGTRFYAFVGVGGTGKSTLLKNVFYYMDNSFNLSRLRFNVPDFVNDFPKLEKLNAEAMDEPDDEISSNSKQGKIFRKILGKSRQHQLIIGMCATDLKDIPPYFFRKLDGIFFTPYLGKYMFFKNRPKQFSYVLQEIRKKYNDIGYKVFFQLKKDVGCLYGDTIKATPFDAKHEKSYTDEKWADYMQDVKDFNKTNEKKPETTDRDKIILNMKQKGKTHQEISQLIGLSRRRVSQILSKLREMETA